MMHSTKSKVDPPNYLLKVGYIINVWNYVLCYQTKIKLYREKLHKMFGFLQLGNQKTIKNEKFLHYTRYKSFIIAIGSNLMHLFATVSKSIR